MRNGTPGFQSERLVEGRDSRGLTQVALADLIGRTSSSVSRWEGGDQLPEPDALEALAKALNVPVSFFLRPQPDHGPAPMFFRSQASTTLQVRKRTRARLRWAQDISLKLQEWVDLPQPSLPRLDANDHREIRDEDIERIANECRTLWGLGSGPISDVLLVLENAGIVVVKEEVGAAQMDGVSNWSNSDHRPYMLIARDKATAVRSRMDAAHELGHLVLHHSLTEKSLSGGADFKEIERQAFLFAGAFLMPAETFAAEIWSPTLNTFLVLKERWKVSIGGMMMRSSALEIINDDYERRLWKYYSARGWRKSEPLDDVLVSEEPRLLARSVRLLTDEGIRTKGDLLVDFRLEQTDVENLCSLPRGFMAGGGAEVFSFPVLKSSDSKPGTTGNVVPLKRT